MVHDTCALSFGPSVLAPVFYGYRDYDTVDGAPGPVRVYFPSIDGTPASARYLQGCGLFPLVIFLHGNCSSEPNHYRKWVYLPYTLARGGYVVAAPRLPGVESGSWDADVTLVQDLITWMRHGWRFRAGLERTTGIVGHSYGAMLGAVVAPTVSADAYVSLSGGWIEWFSTPPPYLSALAAPSLFMWGTGDDSYAVLDDGASTFWDAVPAPKHRVSFDGANHWDYLPPRTVRCQDSAGRCRLVDELAGDLATTFLTRSMPPRTSSTALGTIPFTLVPPTVTLTSEQLFYSGSYLLAMDAVPLPASGPCRVLNRFTPIIGVPELPWIF